jgi:hypothetical protein
MHEIVVTASRDLVQNTVVNGAFFPFLSFPFLSLALGLLKVAD